MVDQPPALDASDFLQAALLERDRARLRSRRALDASLADLHRSRDAFRDGTDDPEAADRDADRLEHLADRLVDWSGVLLQDLERLEIACDQTGYRRGLRIRARSAVPRDALVLSLAEILSEDALSGPAGAVLRTAVIVSAQRRG